MHTIVIRYENGTEHQISTVDQCTIIHALRVSANRFDEDAKLFDKEDHPRVAEQFRRQATDARRLAKLIED